MIISILHLSDIHFSKDRNVVFQRKEKIFDSIKNELKGKDLLFILTSGDIAFSGIEQEYHVAIDFYKYLYQSIREYSDLEGRLLFVPGNHDCLFDEKQDEVRKLILSNLNQNGLTELSENLIDICCKPQDNFNSFVSLINKKLHDVGDIVFNNPLLKILTFKAGDRVIKFNCFNTSWDSIKHEKIGNLKFPINYLYDQIPTIDNFLSISIVHHPFNWQTPETSKQFRESLIESSEIIISGHEHQETESIISDLDQSYKTIHIESGALQESNNDRNSEFNIINIDTEKLILQIKTFQFNNDDHRYIIKKDSEWLAIDKEKKLKTKLFQLKKSYLISELENPGASFTHSQIDDVKLSHIYTPPIFNNISFDRIKKTKFFNFIHSEVALNLDENQEGKFYKLVLGSEGSGKTALLKYFYLKFYSREYIPVYISVDNITDVRSDKLKSIVGKEFRKQYNELESKFEEIDFKKIVLLIDDMHRYQHKRSKITLIRNLTKLFDKIIITGNELMLFESYTDGKNNSIEVFEPFDQYIIQEFNPTLRNTIVNKWYRLGKEYLDEEEKTLFYKQIDIATENINVIIGKNLIPAYPIYILSILQALESGQTDSTSNNLHAYYYEMLITRSLRKALKDQDDIGFYMTLAKEYFYFLFTEKIRFKPLSSEGFKKFLQFHSDKYTLSSLNAETILNVFRESRIIKSNETDEISITFKYLYYYFVAKYLSDNIDDEEIKKIIDRMTDRVYREEYSNIILFLTHLSKNAFIIEKLIEKSKKIYAGAAPLKLEEDIDFINVLQKETPIKVLEELNVEKSRQDNLAEEDQFESEEKEIEEELIQEDYDLNEDINSLDHISILTKALRTMSILGQLTKKYWGEILGPVKYNLAEETFMIGLRTLKTHFELIEKSKEGLSEHITKVIQKRFIKDELSKSEIEAVSANFIFTISSASVFGVFKRVINSIGTEKLANTFYDIQKAHDYTSTKLINTGIKLDHYSSFPMGDIEELKKKNEKNPLALSALQSLVIDHLYMYPLQYDKMQQVCDLLNIKIQDQRFIAQTSQIKKN